MPVAQMEHVEHLSVVLLLSYNFFNPFMASVDFLSDINECLTIVPSPCSCGVSGVPCGANCINHVPSFTCSCAPGFQLRSGGKICDGNISLATTFLCEASRALCLVCNRSL